MSESEIRQPAQEQSVRDEEEQFIKKITEPKQPKSRGAFINA